MREEGVPQTDNVDAQIATRAIRLGDGHHGLSHGSPVCSGF